MYDNKRKLLGILILAALLFSLFTVYIYAKPKTSAKAAALYEPETNEFLYLKNADARLPMASTTKIMTALLAIENLAADKIIEITEDSVGVEGSSLYLKAGELISAEDLIYACLLQSANDAATALAIEISGSIENFSALMNERAKSLGLTNTQFMNPHGLDAEGHYTSAKDLAVIAANALSNERFAEISSTYKWQIETSNGIKTVVNHNKLLKSFAGCIGVKTGYTKKSGRSLVSAAERDGLRLIAVTINAPDDWRDHKTMLDYGYSMIKKETLSDSGQYKYTLPVICGDKESVTVSNKEALYIITKKDGSPFTVNVKLPKYLIAPMSEGEVVGEIEFIRDGVTVGILPLTLDETIKEREKKDFIPFLDKA